MTDQPGYDALAGLYAKTFPQPYETSLEQHAVRSFADLVKEQTLPGVLVDVGCGLGHITNDLALQGLEIVGVDPSTQMLGRARSSYPDCQFVHDDARLEGAASGLMVKAILARYSLIHIDPDEVPHVLAVWVQRVARGGVVLIACQASDGPGVTEFDHRVARAWRWHPDTLAEALKAAGFAELWRTVSRPDTEHRFPAIHLAAQRT
ncbi:MAG: class I SAM-dependent methyltransferase [Rhodococcus sp.]|nr:class I SAM-dependent methyltransferase [Rhodococcus sp. (in: high G+C Gram-positive bacteria)]